MRIISIGLAKKVDGKVFLKDVYLDAQGEKTAGEAIEWLSNFIDPSTPLPQPEWFEFEEQDRVNRDAVSGDGLTKAFNSMYDRGVIGND